MNKENIRIILTDLTYQMYKRNLRYDDIGYDMQGYIVSQGLDNEYDDKKINSLINTYWENEDLIRRVLDMRFEMMWSGKSIYHLATHF